MVRVIFKKAFYDPQGEFYSCNYVVFVIYYILSVCVCQNESCVTRSEDLKLHSCCYLCHGRPCWVFMWVMVCYRVLLRSARKLAQQYYLMYEEQIPTAQLVQRVANVMQEYTQQGWVTPTCTPLIATSPSTGVLQKIGLHSQSTPTMVTLSVITLL